MALEFHESTNRGWSALAGHLKPGFVHCLRKHSHRSPAAIVLNSFLEIPDNKNRDPMEVLEIISEKCATIGNNDAKKIVDDELNMLNKRKRGSAKPRLRNDLAGTPKDRQDRAMKNQVSFSWVKYETLKYQNVTRTNNNTKLMYNKVSLFLFFFSFIRTMLLQVQLQKR